MEGEQGKCTDLGSQGCSGAWMTWVEELHVLNIHKWFLNVSKSGFCHTAAELAAVGASATRGRREWLLWNTPVSFLSFERQEMHLGYTIIASQFSPSRSHSALVHGRALAGSGPLYHKNKSWNEMCVLWDFSPLWSHCFFHSVLY